MTNKLYFTRPSKSNTLSMAIIGLPNVGKSTLFNCLTHQNIPTANFPFCTITPNHGIVTLPDSRIDYLAKVYNPASIVYPNLTISDIAGLIKGASEGKGLGNEFLEYIRGCDGLFHVVRCFEDKQVVNVEEDVDPVRDYEVINNELVKRDQELVARAKARLEKERKVKEMTKDKVWLFELATVNKIDGFLKEQGKFLTNFIDKLTDDEIRFVSKMNLLTTKKMVLLANVSEREWVRRRGGKHLKALINRVKGECEVIVFSAEFEEKMSLEDVDKVKVDKVEKEVVRKEVVKKEVIKKENIKTVDVKKKIFTDDLETKIKIETKPKQESFLAKLGRAGYNSLNLINFYTAGKDEVKAWTIRKGCLLPKAGSVIHSDFEQYFVKGEVMNYADLERCGSEVEVRKEGKYMTRGKDYVVVDGDIIYFRSNPPKGDGKKKKEKGK